jgi:hypothetical protein
MADTIKYVYGSEMTEVPVDPSSAPRDIIIARGLAWALILLLLAAIVIGVVALIIAMTKKGAQGPIGPTGPLSDPPIHLRYALASHQLPTSAYAKTVIAPNGGSVTNNSGITVASGVQGEYFHIPHTGYYHFGVAVENPGPTTTNGILFQVYLGINGNDNGLNAPGNSTGQWIFLDGYSQAFYYTNQLVLLTAGDQVQVIIANSGDVVPVVSLAQSSNSYVSIVLDSLA